MAYHPPIFPNTYMRSSLPYQVSYHPPFYHPYPTHFDPSVSLANPYIYDPTQVKHRRRTTPEQLKVLEDTFKTDPKPSPALRRQLSTQLGMSPRVLQVWFQNRRMKVKRLAKKASTPDQRAASTDVDGDADPSSTSPTDNALPASPSDSADPDDTDSPQDAERPSPPPDLAHRRVSLPVNTTSASPSPAAFDALVDPGIMSRRRSLASLQRLESHPNISVIAASNSHVRPGFVPIVPPSLPPSFRSYHHHSPSTPLTRIASAHAHRPASFHVIPPEAHQHLSFHPSQHNQPYAFPPRPIPAPGPGPLPAADFSFGTPAYHQHPHQDGNDTDATGSEYTDGGNGYRSRFGSFASIAESDMSGSEWEGQVQELQDGRRPSWAGTGEVAEMLSGLDVSGSGSESNWEGEQQPLQGQDDTTPPAYERHRRAQGLPISQSSELAYALSNKSPSPTQQNGSGSGSPHQYSTPSPASASTDSYHPHALSHHHASLPSHQHTLPTAHYPPHPSCGPSADDPIEMHHALAAYAEDPSLVGMGIQGVEMNAVEFLDLGIQGIQGYY